MTDTNLYGCDDLREWLIAQGFRVTHNTLARDNDCNWYAYRRSEIPARACEHNERNAMQLVVWPHRYARSDGGGTWESVEVDVTGEAGGLWYKLQAYSLTHAELRERIGEIEEALVSAWNALLPNAMLSELKRLRDWIEGDCCCPCCEETRTCADGCTFGDDDPSAAARMYEARQVLYGS